MEAIMITNAEPGYIIIPLCTSTKLLLNFCPHDIWTIDLVIFAHKKI